MNLDIAVPPFGAARAGRVTSTIVLRIAAIAAFLALALGPALSAEALRLRAEVTVGAGVLTLADLVEGATGAAAATPVFSAPGIGETGTIQAARIVEAARRLGLAVDAGGVRQVVVTRAARRIESAEIETALKRELELRHGVDARGLSVVFDGATPALVTGVENNGPVAVANLVYDRRSRRVAATVSAGGDGAIPGSSVRVAGSAVELVDVIVVNRSLARGDRLQPSDYTLERRPRDSLPGDVQPEGADVTGRIARRSIPAGSVLRAADTAKPEVVARGDLVTVVYEIPGLTLTLRARATEAGAQGDSIAVLNPQSKKTLQATVTGPGKVSVTAGTPGLLAARAAPRPATP